MKRKIVEIGGGVALFAVVATLQAQLVDLRERQDSGTVATVLHDPVERFEQREDRQRMERLAAGWQRQLGDRLALLERRIDAVTSQVATTSELGVELEQARREARAMQTALARDVDATRSLVHGYEAALRETDARTRETTAATRTVLEQLHDIVPPDPETLTRELLLPTVQFEGRDTVGSGTLVRSARNAKTGEVENYVLTAYHVVRNIFADTPTAKRDGISVRIYLANGERLNVRGDMIAHQRSIDVAVVKLRGDRLFSNVARVLPRHRADEVDVWDPVVAVGCPLGNDPIPTRGVVTSTRNVLNGTNYWMINAPTYYGNSGGGIFLAENRELVGVFSKIYTHGRGVPVVVPHMGLCTPMATVYEWLEDEGLGHVLPEGAAPAADPGPQLAAPPK